MTAEVKLQHAYRYLPIDYRRWFDPYINRLRNMDKRDYAKLYAVWRVNGGPFDSVGGPDDPTHALELGYMARQAVRMEINAIYEGRVL